MRVISEQPPDIEVDLTTRLPRKVRVNNNLSLKKKNLERKPLRAKRKEHLRAMKELFTAIVVEELY